MARVEWSALSGDEVETVLSNLLYNWNEHALRIRPSQGDYGIDVIVPTAGVPKKWDVFQIKKFATNLDASQKAQIEESFRRVLVALVRRAVPLNNWYLVTPLDPTLNNLLDWFEQIPARAVDSLVKNKKLKLTDDEIETIKRWLDDPDRIIAWKGLNFCETLAADYPRVVDFYLHGGRERLREAVAELSALLRTDTDLRARERTGPGEGSVAVLEPGEVRKHLERLGRLLDTDPHFRYGFGLDINRPDLHPEPRLVAATQEEIADGRWLTYKIYARSAQALDEQPIPIKLEFSFEESSADQDAFETWRKYGKPLDIPASFSLGLPGGLDTEKQAGRVRVGPAEGEETRFRNRLRVVDPAGSVLGELMFDMTSTSGLDRTGRWAHGTDTSGVLSTESLLDGTALSGSITFTLPPVVGMPASRTLPALRFASVLSSPNLLEVSGEHGPFHAFSPVSTHEPLVDPTLMHFVEALDTIQSVTAVQVLIPDVEALSLDDIRRIRVAASLIRGETSVGHWTHINFEKHAEIDIAIGGHYQISVIDPLFVPINGAELAIGHIDRKALSARVESVDEDSVNLVPHLHDTMHSDFNPEVPAQPEGKKQVRARPAPPAVK